MADRISGGCLCGAVAFEIRGDFNGFFFCHCSRCRKVTGSAHASNLFSTTASLEWIKGEDNIRIFRLPEARFRKTFCVDCGSALPTPPSEAAPLLVPAGSIESDFAWPQSAHIFCASAAPWEEDMSKAERLDGPPDFSKIRKATS